MTLDPGVARALCGPAVGGWTFDVWITAPLGGIAALYGVGAVRLARRSPRGAFAGAACFVAGWLILALALVSPLHRAGESLFSAHMIEHELVMALAAPLLVLGRPAAVLLWGLPDPLRLVVGRAMAAAPSRRLWAALTAPAVATLLHGLAIWLWHAPPLFEDALADIGLHRLQHLIFLATAILFWWAMLRRADAGVAAWHMFATLLHTSVLGALLALAPRVLFPLQTLGAPAWGLTPLEDQQLAGILMWIPAGTVYAGACLALLATWVRKAGAAQETTHALPLV